MLLNSETSRYVFRIVAFKEILENPKTYGFNLKETHRYKLPEFKTIQIDTSVTSFADFAINQGINYKILKIANPWLRQGYLKNYNKKTYKLKIITSGYQLFTDYAAPEQDSTKVQLNDSIIPKKTIISDSSKTESPIERNN